jgi:phospholipase/carboxylesterase
MDIGLPAVLSPVNQPVGDSMVALDGPRWGPAAGGQPRHLVVLCHGLGADGFDLIDLAPTWAQAAPDAAFVAPHAPEPCDLAPMGRQWFSLVDRDPVAVEHGARTARLVLDGFIDRELARLGLGADRYALMGFSQGAMIALYTGLRRDIAPRAILAYSGALPGRTNLAAERHNTAPVLLVHGEQDEVVPIARSQAAETALRDEGVPVETLWRPSLGHGIDDAGIALGGLFLQRALA